MRATLAVNFQQKSIQNLKAVYVLFGEDSFQLESICQQIHAGAREHDYTQYRSIEIDARFTWDKLLTTVQPQYSLFSAKEMLVLRFKDAPNKQATQALFTLVSSLENTTLLVFILPKLTPSAQQSDWIQYCVKQGELIQARKLTVSQYIQWLQHQAQTKQITLTANSLALLAERTAGNLAAASNTLDWLQLTHAPGKVPENVLPTILGDQATVSMYDIIPTVLQAKPNLVLKQLQMLGQAKIEPTLLVWMLNREIKQLIQVVVQVQQNVPVRSAMQKVGIWQSKQADVQQALTRLSLKQLTTCMQQLHVIDKILKSHHASTVWQHIQSVCLTLAGVLYNEEVIERL